MTLGLLLLSVATLAAALVGIRVYRRIAIRHDIVARPNNRTLHDAVVPRGSGLVIAVVAILAFAVLLLLGWIDARAMLLLGVGGAAAAGLGFGDDVLDVRPSRKLLLMTLLAVWTVGVLWPEIRSAPVAALGRLGAVATVALSLWATVWLVNLFNFTDGIDGLAGSAAVLVAGAIAVAAAHAGGDRALVAALVVVAAATLGFLVYNLPPASIFMGDAGSIFLGYVFAALLVWSVTTGTVSAWTWLAALGYYVGDTTVTNALRPFMVRHFWRGHRSHAYQNLARITGSHARVTWGIVLYQLLWAVPLSYWSATRPAHAPLAALLAVTPAVVLALRYGPLFCKD